MKRTLFISMLFAALMAASCHDEHVATNEPATTTDSIPSADTIGIDYGVYEIPNSEWWECTHVNTCPIETGDTLLLNITWDEGMYFAHARMGQSYPTATLIYNELVLFHMSNDTMYWDNAPDAPSIPLWAVSYPSDSILLVKYAPNAGTGAPVIYEYQFIRTTKPDNILSYSRWTRRASTAVSWAE